MKKIIALIFSVIFVIGLVGCSGSTPSYYGVWSVDSLLPDSPLGNFSEDDMETILNANLTFSTEEATCFGDELDSLGQILPNPEYIKMDIPKDDFESMTGTGFDSLGISDNKITQISVVNDPSYNNGIVFYVVNDDTLLSNSLGTFFVLKKTQ